MAARDKRWEQDMQTYNEIRPQHGVLKLLDFQTFLDAGDKEAADVLEEIGDKGHRAFLSAMRNRYQGGDNWLCLSAFFFLCAACVSGRMRFGALFHAELVCCLLVTWALASLLFHWALTCFTV